MCRVGDDGWSRRGIWWASWAVDMASLMIRHAVPWPRWRPPCHDGALPRTPVLRRSAPCTCCLRTRSPRVGGLAGRAWQGFVVADQAAFTGSESTPPSHTAVQ